MTIIIMQTWLLSMILKMPEKTIKFAWARNFLTQGTWLSRNRKQSLLSKRGHSAPVNAANISSLMELATFTSLPSRESFYCFRSCVWKLSCSQCLFLCSYWVQEASNWFALLRAHSMFLPRRKEHWNHSLYVSISDEEMSFFVCETSCAT